MSITTTSSRSRSLLAVVTLGVAAALLSGCSLGSSAPSRDDQGEVVEGTDNGDVFALQVGDCVNDSDLGSVVSTLPIVPCSDAHDSEVFDETSLSGDDYPGEDAVYEQADGYCLPSFATFVGLDYDSSTLEYYPFVPTPESWDAGDRIVSCMVYDPSGQVEGTLEGSAR